jgi:DNA mismatch repair protein MutS
MQLPEKLAHARNCNVAVRETGAGIVFLHRLEPGGTDRSYGIHVAQLAGLPASIVTRAGEVLATLESEHRVVPGGPPPAADPLQPSLFGNPPALAVSNGDEALRRPRELTHSERTAVTLSLHLRGLDPDSMTPIEALQELARIRDQLEASDHAADQG